MNSPLWSSPWLGLFLLVTAIAVSLLRAQRLAAEARSRLGAIVAYSEDAIIGLTLEGAITSWNSGAARKYGYISNEVLRHPILEIIPPEGQQKMKELLVNLQEGEPIQQQETTHIQKTGQIINSAITIPPIRDRNGQISGASMIARDVTNQKRAEKALQEYTEQLHFLSRRLVEVQENERRFIARELHNKVGQILTGLKLIMEVIPRLPPETTIEKIVQA